MKEKPFHTHYTYPKCIQESYHPDSEIWYVVFLLFYADSFTLLLLQVYGLHVDKQCWKI